MGQSPRIKIWTKFLVTPLATTVFILVQIIYIRLNNKKTSSLFQNIYNQTFFAQSGIYILKMDIIWGKN